MTRTSGSLKWFDSITALCEQARLSIGRNVPEATAYSQSESTPEPDGSRWAGTATLEEAVDFAELGGWEPPAFTEMRHALDDLEPRLREHIAEDVYQDYDVAGHDVDMGRFLEGEPECMRNWLPTEEAVTQRAFCVLINHSVSSGCTGHDLFLRGQMAIMLVRALLLLGYELEIWSESTVMGRSGDSKGNEHSILTKIHGAGEVLDESAIEFAVGNPAWLRRIIFGACEMEPVSVRKQFGFGMGHKNYGVPTDPRHGDTVAADVVLDLGRTWSGKGGTEAERSMDWVVTQLKEFGAIAPDAEIDWS